MEKRVQFTQPKTKKQAKAKHKDEKKWIKCALLIFYLFIKN